MTIERTGRAAAAGNLGRVGSARRDGGVATARVAEAPGTAATVMGISEAEFTPNVRGAVMMLMEEVDALRREVEQMRASLAAAEKDADQDHLLPLLNRRAFVRGLTQIIGMAARYGTPSSLIYFDLDDFKQVNDSHGHAAGDAVLAHFSQVLLDHVRDSDIVGRLGGDEFGVILTHTTQILAHRKAAALAETLSINPAQWSGRPIPVAFSYGTFELLPGESADTAIARADEAMYAQKKGDIR